MGQITSGVNQKTCIFDFSVNGGAVDVGAGVNLGMALDFTEAPIEIFVAGLLPIVGATAPAVTVGAFGFNFTLPAPALINASIGFWLPVTIPIVPKLNTIFPSAGIDWSIFIVDATPFTAGKFLISIRTISTPV